jgi:tetratricopeptide (TPR) repeat protein
MKLSPTIRIAIVVGGLLIVAAVLVSVYARHNMMKTSGPTVAETQIARLVPDLRGPKRREAIRKIEAIARRNDEDTAALRLTMTVYAVAGLHDEAARVGALYLKQADSGRLRPRPGRDEVADVASSTGMAYSESGNDELALRYAERAVKEFPNNPSYLNNLGYFLAEQGRDLPRAVELTNRAVELAPTNAAFLDSYGWALCQSGKYKQSLEPLLRAAEYEPNSAEIRYHLGTAYAKLKRLDEARIELQKSLIIDNTPQARLLLKSIEQ